MEAEKALVKPGENVLDMSRDRFNQLRELAAYLAKSDMIPKAFQGKEANVFIALHYAANMELNPFMALQNLYVVYGRPGIEAKLAITLINSRGGYDQELQYDIVREKDKIISCTAFTFKKRRKVSGPPVTAEMVKGEGWDKPKPMYRDGKKIGDQISKWVTMPEMMYRYRAATFFARLNCPEVLMGLQTREELDDMTVALEPQDDGSYGVPDLTGLQFHELVEEKGGNFEDDNFQIYLGITADALGFTQDQLMEEALSDFDGFWASYERWLAEKDSFGRNQGGAEPETTEATSPEPQEGADFSEDDINHSPEEVLEASEGTESQNEEKEALATPAQVTMIDQLLKKAKLEKEGFLADYGLTDLNEATFDQAGDMLAWLKKQAK